MKSHCHDLRKVTNKKRVVIVDHPFDSSMDTFFDVRRVKGKELWEVIYHEPHALCNKLIINESFNIIESKSILDNSSQSV